MIPSDFWSGEGFQRGIDRDEVAAVDRGISVATLLGGIEHGFELFGSGDWHSDRSYGFAFDFSGVICTVFAARTVATPWIRGGSRERAGSGDFRRPGRDFVCQKSGPLLISSRSEACPNRSSRGKVTSGRRAHRGPTAEACSRWRWTIAGEIGGSRPIPAASSPSNEFHIPHGLKRALKRNPFEIRIDTAFSEVMAVARTGAPPGSAARS